MSTFTDWNGPQGSNIRANDLVRFAEAYTELTAKLNKHLQSNVSSDNVHLSKDYIDDKVTELKGLIPNISHLLSKLDAEGMFVKKSDVPDDVVHDGDLKEYAKSKAVEEALTEYLKKSDLAASDVIKGIEQDIAALEAYFDEDGFTVPQLRATEFVEGFVQAIEQMQFTFKQFGATVCGSDDGGVFYMLGMLDARVGTAYIRYTDTSSFAAVVHFAVTSDLDAQGNVLDFKDGQLSVVTDVDKTDLTNVHFKIVKGTAKGKQHVYLAIQADEWLKHFASTDGVGVFGQIPFEAAGINFVPVNSRGYEMPTGATSVLYDLDYFALADRVSKIEEDIRDINKSIDKINDEFDGHVEETEKAFDEQKKDFENRFNEKGKELDDKFSEQDSKVEEALSGQDEKVNERLEQTMRELREELKAVMHVPVGETMYWPSHEKVTRTVVSDKPFTFKVFGKEYSVEVPDEEIELHPASNVPVGWHALDGTAELEASEYPALADFFCGRNTTKEGKIWLPYVHSKIIKIEEA